MFSQISNGLSRYDDKFVGQLYDARLRRKLLKQLIHQRSLRLVFAVAFFLFFILIFLVYVVFSVWWGASGFSSGSILVMLIPLLNAIMQVVISLVYDSQIKMIRLYELMLGTGSQAASG